MYPTAEVETERETALVGVGWGMRWGEGGERLQNSTEERQRKVDVNPNQM